MSNLTLSKNKVHRHYTPEFKGVLPDIIPVRRFTAALSKHDWNRNPHIYRLRCEKKQRVSVRSERRETYNILAIAMIANADYSPESGDGLFEVMCSTEKLAKLCNQLYTYENGRKSYDPTLKAIHDWEAAKLIVVDEGKDDETKQWKAMRIWLRPEFFHGLGFSVAELRKIVTSFRRWMEKKGLRDDYKKRYAQHILRLSRSNVASLDNKHSLKNLLKKLKRLVLGDDQELEREKKHAIEATKHRKELIKSTQPVQSESDKNFRRYASWKSLQPLAVYTEFENSIKKRYPTAYGALLIKMYVEHLPDH